MINQPEYNIIISPVGEVATELPRAISRKIDQVFGFSTEVMPLLKDIHFALDPARNQYHSTLILEKLADMVPDGALKVLAVTDVDLFIPILTFVYGEAQLGGKACIISTCRLNEGISPINAPAAYHLRVVKESIHELGHTFNLRHCPDHTCIMHYCRTAGDVDRKSDHLCRYCHVLFEDEKERPAGNDPPAF